MFESVESLSAPAVLGECPVWSVQEQVLYWTDIEGRRLHRLDPSSGRSETLATEGRVGSFVLTAVPGTLLIAMENELAWFDWSSGSATSWVELEPSGAGNRLNDGRCDWAGNYVVGTMCPDSASGTATGALYRVAADGSTDRWETEVGVPNGLVFDEQRGRMYWTDTHTQLIHVWDYDAVSGERSNKRVFFDYHEENGYPDGACLDEEGCYWSAGVYGWQLLRITPKGKVDRRVELPVQKPSMPAFGGADLRTLFVTSIGTGGSVPSEGGKDGFVSGALLALDVGVAGLPEPVSAIDR